MCVLVLNTDLRKILSWGLRIENMTRIITRREVEESHTLLTTFKISDVMRWHPLDGAVMLISCWNHFGSDIVSTAESPALQAEGDTSVAEARPDLTVGGTNAVEKDNEARASPRKRRTSILRRLATFPIPQSTGTLCSGSGWRAGAGALIRAHTRPRC